MHKLREDNSCLRKYYILPHLIFRNVFSALVNLLFSFFFFPPSSFIYFYF